MLTVCGNAGARDIQVNNAPGMHDAIVIAERTTGCRVDHGRSGILPAFDPAVTIDWETGDVVVRHDNAAVQSMQIVNPFLEQFSVARGEGSR